MEKKRKPSILQYKDFKTFGPKKEIFDKNSIKRDPLTIEKMRRHQIHTYLDCMLKHTSYFDFFSRDAFRIALASKNFAHLIKKKEVSSEILVFPFFFLTFEFTEILASSKLTKKSVGSYYAERNDFYRSTRFNTLVNNIKKKLLYLVTAPGEIEDDSIIDPSLDFSYEVKGIFEKAAENAVERFKTPIITPELLLITIMEEKQTKGGKMIKRIINDLTEFYVLRFKLLKRLHYEETRTRLQVNKSQLYFAYLAKMNLTMSQYKNALDLEYLNFFTAHLRYTLVTKAFHFDLTKFLEKEIYMSLTSPKNKRTSYDFVDIPLKSYSERLAELRNQNN